MEVSDLGMVIIPTVDSRGHRDSGDSHNNGLSNPATSRFSFGKRVVASADNSGNRLHHYGALAITARSQIAGDRLGGFTRKRTIRVQLITQRRRKALLDIVGGFVICIRLAPQNYRKHSIFTTDTLEIADLFVHPARSSG